MSVTKFLKQPQNLFIMQFRSMHCGLQCETEHNLYDDKNFFPRATIRRKLRKAQLDMITETMGKKFQRNRIKKKNNINFIKI